ncbi:putative EF-hand domain pair protein [Senna tora]|uniref:Putative EF-hand domain pair protein n=1 Tax=Senna tora TaxID=362788 RepID=A0A834TAV1_9FABA|nr:putative EF-hand domain pair protein [Senna tora]
MVQPDPIGEDRRPEIWIMTEKEVRDMVDTVCRKKEGNVNVTVREEELKMILKRIGSSWAAFRAFRCLQYADTNKDGQISGAEIDKLVAYILKWQATKLNKY